MELNMNDVIMTDLLESVKKNLPQVAAESVLESLSELESLKKQIKTLNANLEKKDSLIEKINNEVENLKDENEKLKSENDGWKKRELDIIYTEDQLKQRSLSFDNEKLILQNKMLIDQQNMVMNVVGQVFRSPVYRSTYFKNSHEDIPMTISTGAYTQTMSKNSNENIMTTNTIE